MYVKQQLSVKGFLYNEKRDIGTAGKQAIAYPIPVSLETVTISGDLVCKCLLRLLLPSLSHLYFEEKMEQPHHTPLP